MNEQIETSTDRRGSTTSGRTNGGSVTDRLAGAAHEAIDSAATSAEAIEKDARERASAAADSVEATRDAAAEKIDDSIASLSGFVKQRPVAAVGIAFAIGVVATSLLRR